MPNFEFNARDSSGGAQVGVLEGSSAAAVVSQLRSRGWMVTSVREKTGGQSKDKGKLTWLPFMGPRAANIELSLQQLSVMLRGGLTLLSSLQTLAEQSTSRPVRQLWNQVTRDIQEGATFSDAIGQYEQIPSYVVRLVRVGEQTGVLESVLVRGAAMMRSRRDAVRDIITAMAYPMIVLVAAFGATAYMVGFLIPKLGAVLESMGKPLPKMTRILVDIANFVQAYGVVIFLVTVVVCVTFTLFYMTPHGRLLVDRIALAVPIAGKIFRVSGANTFAQTLSTLIESGVTMLDALVTVQKMHYNQFQATAVQTARENVIHGRGLAESLRPHKAYTPLLITMTAVGEESGSLDEVMQQTSEYHEAQLQAMIKQLSAWVTPAVIVVVGTIVGFVYIAFFLALFAVAS